MTGEGVTSLALARENEIRRLGRRGIIRPTAPTTTEGPVPAITVGLPAALTSPQPARDFTCEASTVLEALRAVVGQAPQYEQRIFYGDRLLVVVTLNGRHLPPSQVREPACRPATGSTSCCRSPAAETAAGRDGRARARHGPARRAGR